MQGTSLICCWIFIFIYFYFYFTSLGQNAKLTIYVSLLFDDAKNSRLNFSSKDEPTISYEIEKKKYTSVICAKGPPMIKLE